MNIMNVNFEFLDAEPINNVITNLNYRLDKTVFFGYSDMIEKHRENLLSFMNKYCGGQTVEFVPVKRNDLRKILSVMRETVLKEKVKGNNIFFDVTGGEAMMLVAFGMLSAETGLPVHAFNVETGRLRAQQWETGFDIREAAEARQVDFDIEALIELMGGTVIEGERKSNKLLDDKNITVAKMLVEAFEEDPGRWTSNVKAFRNALVPVGDGYLRIDTEQLGQNKAKRVNSFIRNLEKHGLAEGCDGYDGSRLIRFLNNYVYKNIMEEGAVLEIRTCMELREKYRYVQAGVNVDWNRNTHEPDNVENEVDVIALDGFVPVIVSCKAGNNVGKEALYELDIVADRFGGKYAKRMLVTVHPLNRTTTKRAAEMGIEIEVLT